MPSFLSFDGLLADIVADTELIDLETPPLGDFIGPRRLFREVPALPDIYVETAAPRTRHSSMWGYSEDDEDDEDDGARRSEQTYIDRFTPHLLVELRYDIARNFADVVAASGEGGWNMERHVRQSAKAQKQQKHKKGNASKAAVMAWNTQTPFNPELMRLCIPVKSTKRVQRGRASWISGSTGDLFISVFSPGAPKGKDKDARPAGERLLYKGKRSIDGDVRTAARQGIKSVLYKGDVVVVLVPFITFAEEWRDEGDDTQGCERRVLEAVKELPLSWRQLGCVPRLALVRDILFKENVAQLSLFPPILPRNYLGPALKTLPAHPGFGQRPPFYVKKLTVIGAVKMQLEAVHRVHSTRFAKIVQDPRVSASESAAYVERVQLSAGLTGSATPLLLQKCLNKWQLSAVRGVLFAVHPSEAPQPASSYHNRVSAQAHAPDVVIIEGPPGTGKTQTIATAILNVLYHHHRARSADQSEGRVLVCAPSNCAVDEVLLRLHKLVKGADSSDLMDEPASTLKDWKLLRVGVRDKVDPDVLRLEPCVYLEDLVEAEMRIAATSGEEEWQRRKRIQRELVLGASVIFSTLGSLHRVQKIADEAITYDAVIVDEASQCTEPAVLSAMLVAASDAALVLVGDSKQLQPTILSTESSKRGMRRSLLVRLLACGHKSFLLRTQYRMHPDICAFPNAYFYEGNLETHKSVMERQDEPICDAATSSVAAVFEEGRRFRLVDVPTGEMQTAAGSCSSHNRAEALAVVQYMRQLRTLLRLSVKDMAPQLGIITFYNAQKDLILSLLTREERQSGLQVASVDSFQGKEKRIILLSCVRTLAKANSGPGFLAHWNRLNVALTRAKDLCVCFCNFRWVRTLNKSDKPLRNLTGVTSVARTLSTLKSTPDEVVRQLDAHDQDPLALFRMLEHAEDHNAINLPAPSLPEPKPITKQ